MTAGLAPEELARLTILYPNDVADLMASLAPASEPEGVLAVAALRADCAAAPLDVAPPAGRAVILIRPGATAAEIQRRLDTAPSGAIVRLSAGDFAGSPRTSPSTAICARAASPAARRSTAAPLVIPATRSASAAASASKRCSAGPRAPPAWRR